MNILHQEIIYLVRVKGSNLYYAQTHDKGHILRAHKFVESDAKAFCQEFPTYEPVQVRITHEEGDEY